MKIGLRDLSEILFEQMERMNDDNLSPEDFKKEIARSNSLAKLAAPAYNVADLALRVQQAYGGDLDVNAKVP
jgi:hypothetical protein